MIRDFDECLRPHLAGQGRLPGGRAGRGWTQGNQSLDHDSRNKQEDSRTGTGWMWGWVQVSGMTLSFWLECPGEWSFTVMGNMEGKLGVCSMRACEGPEGRYRV